MNRGKYLVRSNTNAAIAFVSSFIGLAPPTLGQPSFQGLGDLPGGVFSSEAEAVSADGLTVAGFGNTATGTEAFRWTYQDGMVGLGHLPGATSFGSYHSHATGVSSDGSVIVGLSTSSASGPTDFEAFRWTTGGMVGLGDLPGADFDSRATGVSSDGSIVVGFGDSTSSAGLSEAIWWDTGSGPQGLGDFEGGSFNSQATGVSGDGTTITGTGTTSAALEAFRWTEADELVGLGDLPGGSFHSRAQAISLDGKVIVGNSFSDLGLEGFRWTEEDGMIGLGTLGGGHIVPRAVSGDGAIIVGEGSSGGKLALIWDSGNGLRTLQDVLEGNGLDLTGWTVQEAWGISQDGQTIVGFAINPDGNREAFVATIGLIGDCNENAVPDSEEADADGDGIIDDCDSCPNYANPIQSTRPRADQDQDCDVDGVDFAAFASCFNKAGNPPRTFRCPPENAAAFDFFDDGDVDGIDFSLFASCYNGAGNPPREENCPQ